MEIVDITFRVNGNEVSLLVPPRMTLLEVIREKLNLTGTKEGCGKGDCGACTVIMNGRAANSCLILAGQLDGKDITTIEALEGESLHPLQQAFIDEGSVQCGFCIPGMIMSARNLLDENPSPTRDEIKMGISGNLCRCTGYKKIIGAIEKVANRNRE